MVSSYAATQSGLPCSLRIWPRAEDADAERADAVALVGVQGGVGRQGEGGGGLLAVPGDALFLQGGGSGEVSVVVSGQVRRGSP